ncbi:hypothetical protein OFT50_09680 [Brachyspira hyodysenteriae]|nr:hypothetical protein [Brachyspira hyodysenteriae]MDA0072344.1 hypothetical protein [Brachyspira hyodysenteriae]
MSLLFSTKVLPLTIEPTACSTAFLLALSMDLSIASASPLPSADA